MSLRRAFLLSLAIHLALGSMAGALLRGLGTREPAVQAETGGEVAFNLVDPATARLGADDVAPGADRPLPDGGGGSARGAAGRPSGAVREGATDADAASDDPVDESASDAVVPATDAPGELAAATTPTRRALPSAAPGRLSPRELADAVGLDVEDLDDAVVTGMFSAMHKYALQLPRPAASTYRQLLRAWIDGLMGYPYPVLEHLADNVDHRFIGGIRIEVLADGRFRLTDLWMYQGVDDPDGRLEGYYRRMITDAAARRFLPPGDAGLPAPHALQYQIVNPRAQR